MEPTTHQSQHEIDPGLSVGALAFARGAAFVFRTPSLWPRAAFPVIVALGLASAFAVAAVFGASALARAWFDGAGGWATAGRVVVGLLAGSVLLLSGLLAAVSLAKPLSGPVLDGIVERHDREMGLAAHPEIGVWSSVGRALRVTLFGLAVSAPLLALLTLAEFVVPPVAVVTTPIKIVVSAFVVTWDLVDYPLSLRGMGARERVQWMRRNWKPSLGFGLVGLAVLLVPVVGLVVLPFGVAGAARLVADVGGVAEARSLGGGGSPKSPRLGPSSDP